MPGLYLCSFFFFFFNISMVDLRLFDILKVNFKDSITFSHPLSHCPPLMTAPLTSNVVKGLAASLWRDRDDPWPRAADPGSSRTSRFIQPHEFNRTRKIKKIAFLTTWMRRWTLMLCLVCDTRSHTRSHRGETSQADLTQLPSLTTGYSNPATWEPFALLYDSFPCTHTVNIHQRVSAHYSTADRFCNDAFLVWISWIKPTTIIVFFFFPFLTCVCRSQGHFRLYQSATSLSLPDAGAYFSGHSVLEEFRYTIRHKAIWSEAIAGSSPCCAPWEPDPSGFCGNWQQWEGREAFHCNVYCQWTWFPVWPLLHLLFDIGTTLLGVIYLSLDFR